MVPLQGNIAQSVQLTWLHFLADPPTLGSSSIAKCFRFEILNRMLSVNGKKTSFQET